MPFLEYDPTPENYAPREPDGRMPVAEPGERLNGVARWLAVAAAIVTALAGILASATITSSHSWPEFPGDGGRAQNWAGGSGTGIMIIAFLVFLLLGVAIFAISRGLLSSPRRAAVAYWVIGAVLGIAGAVLAVAPSAIMERLAGEHIGAGTPTDVMIAGLGLLLAAGLLVVAASCFTAAARAQRSAGG